MKYPCVTNKQMEDRAGYGTVAGPAIAVTDIVFMFLGLVAGLLSIVITFDVMSILTPFRIGVLAAGLGWVLIRACRLRVMLLDRRLSWWLLVSLFSALFLAGHLAPHYAGGQDQGYYTAMSEMFSRGTPLVFFDSFLASLPMELKQLYVTTPVAEVKSAGDGYSYLNFYPLHPAAMALARKLFGPGTHTAWLLAAFGVVILALYILTYEISDGDKGAASLAAILAAVNPAFVFFAKLPVTEMTAAAFTLPAGYHLLKGFRAESASVRVFHGVVCALLMFGFFLTRMSFPIIGTFLIVLAVLVFLQPDVSMRQKRYLSAMIFVVFLLFFSSLLIYRFRQPSLFSLIIELHYIPAVRSKIWLLGAGLGLGALWLAAWLNAGFRPKLAALSKSFMKYGTVYILKRPLVTMAIVATPGLYKLVSTGELDVGSFHALGGSVQPGFSSLPHNPFYVLILFTSPFLALFLCCIDCTKKQAGYGAALLPSLFLIVCWPVVLTFTTTVPYLYYYGRYLIIEILPVSIIAIALSARAAAFAPLVARTLLGFGIMWCAGFSLAQLDFAQGESGSPFHRIADRMKPGDILIVDGPSVSGSVFVIPLRYALGVPSFILPPTDECRRSHLVAQLRSITDGVLYVLSDKPLFTLAGVTEQPTLVDSIPYGSNRLWAGNRVSQWLLPFRNRYSVDFKATLFKVRRDVGRMYCLGETVSMAARHSSAQYLVSGWSEQEEAHRWSIGKSAVLNLKLTHPPAPTKTLELRMKAFAFAGQTVEIVVDGETIARRFLTSTPEEIVLPFSAAVLKGGNVVIEFKTPESKSPSELGSSRDLRVLGIGIQSFALEQQP
ncbi:hypothetical protein [Rhodoplanes serenus]|uniref:hypothetical protein n=1 Tax=Rhodoplanes serenus TaxID=200615 RepID=UPI0011B93BE7|nr:hypothetical protein [Rhodoplanes serenus]